MTRLSKILLLAAAALAPLDRSHERKPTEDGETRTSEGAALWW